MKFEIVYTVSVCTYCFGVRIDAVYLIGLSYYSRVRDKLRGTLINLGLFSSGYGLIKGGTLIDFFIFYLLNIFFNFFSFSYV